LTNKYGEKINIGSTNRYSPGIALWTFDPKECAISTLEIKPDEEAPPTTGNKKLRVKIVLFSSDVLDLLYCDPQIF